MSPGNFAARRFWRVYPAYAVSIFFSVLVLAIPKVLLAAQGKSFDWLAELQVRDAFVNLALLQQLWPGALKLNGVYWTLVYEIQFYIAYPALLWLLRKFSMASVGIGLLAFEIYFAKFPSPIPCFFLARYFEWFLGVIVAEVIVRHPKGIPMAMAAVCAFVGLGAGVYSVFTASLHPFRDLLLAIGFFGLILLISRARGCVASVLDSRVLVGLGVFSYSLYLIHVPVIDIFWVGLHRATQSHPEFASASDYISLLAIPASLALSYLFYRWFEYPFLQTRFNKTPVSAQVSARLSP